MVLMFLTYTRGLSAQDKFEKESRIARREVPLLALQFVDSLDVQPKVKWYKEEGLNRNSIEAKFKHQKKSYSIEFDTLGVVEDIEVAIDWSSLPTFASSAIIEVLQADCLAHKITKTQRQFSGKAQDLRTLFRISAESEDLAVKYEIVVKCKTEKEISLFEYLFDEKGILISKSKIIFKNSSHLEY